MNRGAAAMKAWRKARKLSQDGAARAAEMSQSNWGRFELAQRLPGAKDLAKLKRHCGIDPNLFLEEISVAALSEAVSAAAAVAGSQPVVSSLLETPAGASSSGAPAAFSGE